MIRKNANSAFTLIELLVVISIVAVLASVVLASTAQAKRRSQDAQIISQKNQVKNALELYASTNGGYPNPTPGTKSLWCIGGNGCSFYSNGTQYAVTNKLPGLSISNFTLPAITDDDGYDQGIIYESCVSDESICPSATSEDIIDPNESDAARLISSTYASGDDQTFVGIWEDVFDPYEPEEEALDSLEPHVDVWITYSGSDFGKDTLNDSYDSATIPENATYTVTWRSQNVDSCTYSHDMLTLGGYVFVPLNGSGFHEPPMTPPPGKNSGKTYSMQCTGPNGDASDSVSVI